MHILGRYFSNSAAVSLLFDSMASILQPNTALAR
jgi:hypothetical protein